VEDIKQARKWMPELLHIMSGKAIARAVCAHCMVEAALTVMLIKQVLSTMTFAEELSDLRAFYSYIISNGFDVSVAFPDGLQFIKDVLADLKRDLAEKSCTAKLWLQYDTRCYFNVR